MLKENEATTGATSPEQFHPDDVSFASAEPWESWETQLVIWSIGIGLGGLVILGTLINIFILD